MVCLNVARDEKFIVGGNELETFVTQKSNSSCYLVTLLKM